MNYTWKNVLAAAMGAALLLTGCGKTEPPAPPAPEGSSSVTEPEKPDASLPEKPEPPVPGQEDPDKSQETEQKEPEQEPEQKPEPKPEPGQKPEEPRIREIISEEGVIRTEWGEVEYSYHVPQLTADTESARSINSSIGYLVGDQVREDLEEIGRGGGPLLTRAAWTAHWNGDLLSLVLETGGVVKPAEHHVFNYDFKSGEWLTGFEVIHAAGIDHMVFQRALARAVGRSCDNSLMHMGLDFFGPVNQMKAESLSFGNLTGAQIYLEEGGKPTAIAEISTPAGAGVYEEELPLELKPDHSRDMSVTCEFIEAKLSGDELTLTFRDRAPADFYLSRNVKFNKPYKVSGLYGNYVDMEICSMGQDFYPYVFLADEQGGVTFCNVLECAETGEFFAAGPMSLPGDVIRFEQRPVDGVAQTAYAHTKSGEDVDLSPLADLVENSAPEFLERGTWVTDNGRWSLSFMVNETIQAQVYDISEPDMAYSGSVKYLGLDGAGLHYRVTLRETNPMYSSPEDYEKYGVIDTLVTVPCIRPYLDFDGNSSLYLSTTGGKALFGTPAGEVISMTRTAPAAG